jgi:methylase of polypeptide subunit release factors
MAQMLRDDDLEARFHREVKALITTDVALQAITLTAGLVGQDPRASEDSFRWWLRRAWPLLKPRLQPVEICDPCVGSGILLLAHAASHPLWLSQIGYLRYTGADIDPLCVEMCRLNLRLYGLIPLRLEVPTLEALADGLAKITGPWTPAYQAILEAPVVQQSAAKAALVERINRGRIEQLSLFEE